MASLLGAALLVLGLVVAGAAWYLQGEVTGACSSSQAQVGGLLGHPDAEACRSYPPLLNMGMLGGLGVAGLGLVVLVLRR